MTNFIGIQKPPPLLPFPPPSVPHTLCLASKSRECSRKKEREMGKHTKAVEKKNVCGELEISVHAGGLSACCASRLPLQGQVSSPSAQSCPRPRRMELARGPIPACCSSCQPIVLHCAAWGVPLLLQNPGCVLGNNTSCAHALMQCIWSGLQTSIWSGTLVAVCWVGRAIPRAALLGCATERRVREL